MWRQFLDKLGEKAFVYNGIQRIVGSNRVWNGFLDSCTVTIENWNPSDIWLDLGCGTAEVLGRLPTNISYIGVDSNVEYIEFAKDKYKDRPNTTFVCSNWNHSHWHTLLKNQMVGVVSLLGLLHHLDTPAAKSVLTLSLEILKRNGMLITLDGCNEIHASKIERFFYWIDRGQYIRGSTDLRRLFSTTPDISLHNNWLRVPYCYAICRVYKR